MTTSLKIMGMIFIFLFSLHSFSAPRTGKYFDRALFVIFENTDYSKAIQQPFLKQLALNGTYFSNFMAATHPSQGNYVALTSGDLNGVTNDNPINLNVNHIADLLEARGLTWKVYAEDYPGNCFTGKSSGGYVRKHNPFISYLNIQNNPKRCANIVNAAQFDVDAANNSLPNYALYIPNLNNDGHDTGVSYADQWYSHRFTPYLSNAQFMQNTVVITTFDESSLFSFKNQIYTSIFGPAVKPGNNSQDLNLYSLLALIEENWNLGNLGKHDATANPIRNIWR